MPCHLSPYGAIKAMQIKIVLCNILNAHKLKKLKLRLCGSFTFRRSDPTIHPWS